LVTDVSGEAVQEYCLKDYLDLVDGTERLSGNVGDLNANILCVTSQKSGDPIYIAAEA
jgi:hypothetical protein